MDDYRCWASLQWWQEVYRRFPLGGSESTEMNERRSRELAIDACQNMSETPWLQKITYNKPITRKIECEANEFHKQLIWSAITGFVQQDASNIAGLEPVLLEIIILFEFHYTRYFDISI
ncbi:hypothetical protein BofuT4_P098230.1 [Botrytis cinerea T4]|uniref:Uncharacterized protein n=1 Tax=Botryotinia fuckeliana (strain T4) TaxID=999810 RepID=G2YCL8_BOTF4|nr:hypothetical protein BofuT4_P098230.1 [Botrytis cinerea T4]